MMQELRTLGCSWLAMSQGEKRHQAESRNVGSGTSSPGLILHTTSMTLCMNLCMTLCMAIYMMLYMIQSNPSASCRSFISYYR
jgi:hypothetical protein